MDGFHLINENEAFELIDGFVGDITAQTLKAFHYTGVKFTEIARDTKTFQDRTGHLKASIGYVVALNGKVINEAFGFGDGSDDGRVLARNVLSDYSDGLVLIGVAGKEYGIYVEARGKAVISQAINPVQKILNDLLTD